MKAVVSITIDDEFVVHDIKVIEGEKGLFIAMPSRKAGDGDFRDIAVVVPAEVTNEEIEGVIRAHAGELLRSVRVFDIYTGKQVAAGCKSMAFNLTYQAADRTLTDAEVDASMKAVIAEVAEAYKAKLRE